jgi:hypothetical protein
MCSRFIGFENIAGVMAVSAEKLTAKELKQCQRLAFQNHRPDGKAFILLSSSSSIRVLNTTRKFTSYLSADVSAGISGKTKRRLK